MLRLLIQSWVFWCWWVHVWARLKYKWWRLLLEVIACASSAKSIYCICIYMFPTYDCNWYYVVHIDLLADYYMCVAFFNIYSPVPYIATIIGDLGWELHELKGSLHNTAPTEEPDSNSRGRIFSEEQTWETEEAQDVLGSKDKFLGWKLVNMMTHSFKY